MLNNPLVRPAAVGGLVTGVLSALPIVSLGNVCCCLWVVSGGVTAVYLFQQGQSTAVTAIDGALVGLLSGLWGAFVYLVLSIPITLLTSGAQRQLLESLADSGQVAPEFRQFLESPAGPVALIATGFLFILVAGIVFSTLGGILAAAVLGRSRPDAVPTQPLG